MKLALTTLAAGLTLMAAPALAADNAATTAYKALCLATGGTLKPTLAAADAAGWAPIPEELIASGLTAMGEMKMQEVGARVMVVDRRFLALVVGVGEIDQDDSVMEMTLCGVISYAKDGKALVADITALNGVGPISSDDPDMASYAMWLYVDGPKGREYFNAMDNLRTVRALMNGELMMLMVGEDDGMSMILRMRPVVAEKN